MTIVITGAIFLLIWSYLNSSDPLKHIKMELMVVIGRYWSKN